MMKKLILHIGSTKTGSSAIQAFFWENRSTLEGLGILYPDVGVSAGAHHILAAALHPSAWRMHTDVFAERDRVAYFGELANGVVQNAEKSPASKIFLSSEYLWGQFSQTIFDNLRALFQNFDVTVLCYLRRQDEWLESTYAQAVKSGESRTFREWLLASLDKGHGFCHYDRILRQWEKLVPASNIHVRVYGSAGFSNSITDCLDYLGVQDRADLVFPRGNINPTPRPIETEIIRYVNLSDLAADQKRKLRKMLRKRSEKKEPHERFYYLSASETLELLKRYESGNAYVADRYLSPGSKQLFSNRLPHPHEWQAWEGPSPGECMTTMIKIAAELLTDER